MIVNLASGRGTPRIITQKNRLLHKNRFQKRLLENGEARTRNKPSAHSKLLQARNKRQNLANRYLLLVKEAEELAYKVMKTGDGLGNKSQAKSQPTKEGLLKRLKDVEAYSTIELETGRIRNIANRISSLCPEATPEEADKATISQLKEANQVLLEAKEFLEIVLEREIEKIETYQMIEHYGDVLAEVVNAYNALDVLEEMVGKEVKIEVTGRSRPVGKDALFRLFRQRMIGTIEDVKNPAGEIYEQRIHTITTGEWDDMIEAASQGVGATTKAPGKERIAQAFKEAVLARNTFVFAARELYTKLGGQTKALEPTEADVVPVDFARGKKL